MKTVVIREFDTPEGDCIYELDLRKRDIKDCTGCFCCWLKTPGKCALRDLDEFCKYYLQADRLVIYSRITKNGYVSGKIKALIERLIPHYLPYIEVLPEGCNHKPRYDKYPDIHFYYQGTFHTDESKQFLEEIIKRTFVLYRAKEVIVKEIGERVPE